MGDLSDINGSMRIDERERDTIKTHSTLSMTTKITRVDIHSGKKIPKLNPTVYTPTVDSPFEPVSD